MKRRYMIMVDGLDKDAEKKIIEFLRDNDVAWWHRIPNVWLVTDSNEQLSATIIRDFIKSLPKRSGGACLVMQISQHDTWAGYRRQNENDTFEWLKKNWTNK